MKITVDFAAKCGKKIKPLHGINNSPIALYKPLPELRQAGIPYVRLHDAGGAYGGNCYVDIPNVFPDFNADENDPASYRFEFTDAYFKQLVASGMKIFYRLGVTIENNYRLYAYRIAPPADPVKWARICEHIVRHYNEGWANGFHYGIDYWEIWNEPENPPMWSGTREQFFELYQVTATHLRQCFPNIKIGGYASCGFYAINRPNPSDFFKSFLTWFDEFLQFVRDKQLPLDFYSWHLYTTDPEEIILHARYVRKKLDDYGFRQVESIFNEWNFVTSDEEHRWDLMKEAPGAAFVAAAFVLMQRNSIDKAMYYDALPTRRYCGLYYFPSGKTTKTYCSFLAFNQLYKLGEECAADCDGKNAYVLAAAAGNKGAVLAVNNSKRGRKLSWDIQNAPAQIQAFLISNRHELDRVDFTPDFSMPPYSVLLLLCNDELQKTEAVSAAGKFAGLG